MWLYCSLELTGCIVDSIQLTNDWDMIDWTWNMHCMIDVHWLLSHCWTELEILLNLTAWAYHCSLIKWNKGLSNIADFSLICWDLSWTIGRKDMPSEEFSTISVSQSFPNNINTPQLQLQWHMGSYIQQLIYGNNKQSKGSLGGFPSSFSKKGASKLTRTPERRNTRGTQEGHKKGIRRA